MSQENKPREWTIEQDSIEISDNYYQIVQIASGDYIGKEKIKVIEFSAYQAAQDNVLKLQGEMYALTRSAESRIIELEAKIVELELALADRSEKYKIAMDKGVDVLKAREQKLVEIIKDCLTTLAEEVPAVKMVEAENVLKELGIE